MRMSNKELEWHKRYLRIAKEVSTWTSCLRRGVGSVITVNRRLVATGYNGAPTGVKSCKELNHCLREGRKSGEGLDLCRGTHSEQNALIQAARYGISVNGGDMYVTTLPCLTCMKLIINAGIKRVFFLEDYNSPLTSDLAKEAGVKLIKINL